MGSVRDKIIAQIRAAKKGLTEEGHFVKDDPKTPENEAWVEKPKSEVKAKPKAKAKLKVKKTTKKK